MTREELLYLSAGENIDRLITLDMRGTGVPRILYEGARSRSGGPVCLSAAAKLDELSAPGDSLYFLTGFVFEPHGKGELDGLTGTVLLVRALLLLKEVKPVIFCEEMLVPAVKRILLAAGVQPYDCLEELAGYPHACAVIGISTDPETAQAQCADILRRQEPKLVFAIEKPGCNNRGVYHQGNGRDVSYLCAKTDGLFTACQERGIPAFAIGDLGNETGMGALSETVRRYIPLGDRCACGCGGSLLAETSAQYLAVGTTSDWACYGVIAALAVLNGNTGLIPSPDLERKVCERANDCGLIDGSGWAVPSIDGVSLEFNQLLLEMLRQVVEYPLRGVRAYGETYDAVIFRGYFEK